MLPAARHPSPSQEANGTAQESWLLAPKTAQTCRQGRAELPCKAHAAAAAALGLHLPPRPRAPAAKEGWRRAAGAWEELPGIISSPAAHSSACRSTAHLRCAPKKLPAMTLVRGSRDWELEPSKHWEAVTESSPNPGLLPHSCLSSPDLLAGTPPG